MFWERKRLCRCQRLLLAGALMLFATAVLKYSSRECSFSDPGRSSLQDQSEACKDQLYRLLHLSPGGRLSCAGITAGEAGAVREALLRRLDRPARPEPRSPQHYLNLTRDCALFKAERRFLEFPLSREEQEFPVAYSMVVHENIEMFERLLRAIYAPQNLYCVHVDLKSPADFLAAVRGVAACFANVFVAAKRERVVYASWSRVQADLNCMEELLRSPVPWRYLLNTCGADFPIKTNAEIVRSLKVLNGRNNMESERPSAFKSGRWKYRHHVGDSVVRSDTEKGPPPHGYAMFTGSAYIVVTRAFVRALFENPRAQRLLEWSKDTYSPDEHVWATLHRMPSMPGAVPHNDKYEVSDVNALARLVKWEYLEGDVGKGAPYPPCTGTHRRAVCVYGAGDLHWMLQQHHLLANKFDPSVDDTVIQCLEEHLRYKSVYGRNL
ncbi:beta-1,3-galactosyl-O-glycosyl-glycoprotein beta-1,6-N-acetylglucosaminyltransferase 3 [Carettochelys insculpta]|uniref:beta-1,3-galactosyl-O-glycosyl-glycoprotein beta-1,6-N-acetylglucosaminyltransferase 3 n=1 Tax=Carettochelys insculpta TaxID=44489 RepID=UPI003EBF2F8A